MHPRPVFLPALALTLLVASAAPAEPAAGPLSAKLTVHADRPGPRISPMLYGIFFEEINHAGDGGLYAELIRNRSFEDSDKPEGWKLVAAGTAKGEISIDTNRPLNAASPRSLMLVVRGQGSVGVANEGFWGIAVRQDARYNLSLYARSEGIRGPLAVRLESADGKTVYARGQINGLGGDWKQYRLTMTAEGTDPRARLVIAAGQPGTLWLDVVSLFPQATWKGRPNGLRPDVAGMLDGLKPSFVRFPGGCWVEGNVLEDSYHWKTTIGDIAARRTERNLWGYFSPNGLGFHEYLQMCADLGAEPLFVINCGMSHRENVPLDQMGPWVQDALDAVEYANGPVQSRWGSLRAKAGHPQPFHLKYMEIGNENGGPAYEERYALFYDALKAKHPEIHLVANCVVRSRPMEIVDEHYYSSPQFFQQNAARYDAYKRDGYKVYVGEYAVTENAGKGNLRGALGEAAFMTGMERNSDVVLMASYAPLLVNVNNRAWNPDLIGYDSSRVYGTPSYYVQKLFSANRGDVVLPSELELAGTPPAERVRGGIGLGTWSTQAEYKDIKVTRGDRILFRGDFSRGLGGWNPAHGSWTAESGAARQTGGETDCRLLAGDASWGDYTYSLKARKLGGAEGFLVMFHVKDQGNWVWWNLGGWGNVRHALEICRNGDKSSPGEDVPGRIETGRWYDIRIELQGEKIRCYLDGKLIQEAVQMSASLSPVHAVASRVAASGEVLLKLVNASASRVATRIGLEGVGKLQSTAAALVLRGGPADENSVEEPVKVAPVTETVEHVSDDFLYTMPPQSLVILRLKPAS
jgi:alpha-L-arabinofuranosidase